MQKLNTIDADTLLSTPLPATRFIVNSLLPEGLHLLAGAPKTGKSWLALWICLCVSKGEPMWELPTAQGTVLYLCLEDSYARIQNRLFQITDDAPGALHFANLSGRIGGGLEEQAAVLGAGPVRGFFAVSLPELMPGILSSMSMAFILSYSQYFTTLIVGGGRVKTLALVLVPYIQGGDRSLASVYALAFTGSALVVFALFETLIYRWQRRGDKL